MRFAKFVYYVLNPLTWIAIPIGALIAASLTEVMGLPFYNSAQNVCYFPLFGNDGAPPSFGLLLCGLRALPFIAFIIAFIFGWITLHQWSKEKLDK